KQCNIAQFVFLHKSLPYPHHRRIEIHAHHLGVWVRSRPGNQVSSGPATHFEHASTRHRAPGNSMQVRRRPEMFWRKELSINALPWIGRSQKVLIEVWQAQWNV